MTFQIYSVNGPARPEPVAKAADMAAAEAYIRNMAEGMADDPEVIFELDADSPGSADAVILTGGCPQFTVEQIA
jgi:hypothetical protein